MDTSPIQVQEDFPFVVVTLATQNRKNLLTIPIMKQLCSLLEHYTDEPQCKVLILAGNKDYFCFGGDLGNRSEKNVEQILEFADALSMIHQSLAKFPKMTIAVIEGKVGGGGVSLVDACDLAIAAPGVTFEFPELHANSAPMMSLMGVRNSLPKKICYEMMLAKPISADRLLELGVINEISDAEDLVSVAKNYWNQIPDYNLEAMSVCKQYYMSTQGLCYSQQMDIGRHYLVSLLKI